MKKLIAILLAMMTVLALMNPVFASAEEQTENSTMWVNCADGKRLNVRNAPNTKTSQIIYDLKYHDQPDIGIVMGQAAAREFAADNFFEGIDIIIPIPLAKERRRQRGYNQSEMIARGISQETSITVLTDAVMRLHFSESQTHLDRWERLKNVEQQFQAPNPASLSGKHVLLVDNPRYGSAYST